MLHKTLKVLATFALLVAGAIAYDGSFDQLATFLAPPPMVTDLPLLAEPDEQQLASGPHTIAAPSRTPRESEAIHNAAAAFGEDSFAADPDLPIRFYNYEMGYWVYARDYKRHPDGHRIEFMPFALVATSREHGSFKAITGDVATVDFVDKFDPFKPSDKPARVRRARIQGDVSIRDYRNEGRNDLRIGPLDYLEYDEQAQEIRNEESEITIRDRDLLITCKGVRIEMIPASNSATSLAGFGGVKTIRLLTDVAILHDNVGSSGFLPGTQGGGNGPARVPFQLTCQGEATINLPPPAERLPRGEPEPPTIARFVRSVQLRRGDPVPDQLDCDDLEVKLYKPDAVAGRPEGKADESAMSGLEIRYARAVGHNVWLQSPSQGTKARGNELIYKRLGPDKGDETYLTNHGKTIWIEKEDAAGLGDDPSKARPVTTIDTVDATIFQPPAPAGGSRPMVIVAKGPGRMESRPSKQQAPDRVASWRDTLRYKIDEQDQRRLALEGSPMFHDLSRAKIEAVEKLVVKMLPKPRAIEAAGPPRIPPNTPFDAPFVLAIPPEPKGEAGVGGAQIEWIQADGDVKLVAWGTPLPPGQAEPAEGTPRPSRRTMAARKGLTVVFEQPPPRPAVIAGPVAPAAPAPVLAAPVDEEPAPVVAEAKPPEPDLDVKAETVWALIAPIAGSTSKFDARKVFLRGGVEVHRGAEAGKEVGTDVTGEAVDLIGQAEGRFEMTAHGDARKPAEVASDTFRILGPKLTLDQSADTAEVLGPGTLVQFLDRKPVVAADGVAVPTPLVDRGERAGKRPLSVSWKSRMKFHGHPHDPQGRPERAYAEFHSGVDASVDDARIRAEELIAHLDRPVSLARGPADRGGEPEGKPQLYLLHAKRDVTVVNRKADPETGVLVELQRINSENLAYDPNGEFDAIGPGVVRLYKRGGQGAASPFAAADPAAAKSAGRKVGSADPLELTRVEFRKQMSGRSEGPVGGADSSRAAPKVVQFWQDVHVLHGKVGRETDDLSGDRPVPGMVELYSQYLLLDTQGEKLPDGKDTSRTRLMALSERQVAVAKNYGSNGQIDAVIEGDKITYSSDKGLMLTEAFEGRSVSLAKSNGPGQDPSQTTGRQVTYNLKTGASKVDDPGVITLLDPKAGRRPGVAGVPPRGPKPDVIPPFPGRQSDRGTKERKGFNSGQ